jgi:hypothetical protein
MGAAREMAAKILRNQVEADYNFHAAMKRWVTVSYVVSGTGLLMGVLALGFWNFSLAAVGIVLAGSNLAMLWYLAKRFSDHQCILAKVREKHGDLD